MTTRWAHIAQERIRWLGWTLVFTLGLLVSDASLVWFWEQGVGAIVFAGLTLGLAILAFRIGVRFPQEWMWLAVLLVAAILEMLTLARVMEWPEQSGLLLVDLFFLRGLFILPAGAGVWWGKRRKSGHS